VANEWDNVIQKVNKALMTDRAIRVGINTVLAVQKQRIFTEGKDSKGAQIGTYSTTPASISKKNQARQTGKTYFHGGYSEYKSAIGKNPGFVNLQNTSQMALDYGFQVITEGSSYGIGFTNEFNFKKSEWVETHFGKQVFFQSAAEGEVLTKAMEQQIGNDLK
jgi:hypothetical protein